MWPSPIDDFGTCSKSDKETKFDNKSLSLWSKHPVSYSWAEDFAKSTEGSPS